MSASNLEKVLKSGAFAVTGECGPPRGCGCGSGKEERRLI